MKAVCERGCRAGERGKRERVCVCGEVGMTCGLWQIVQAEYSGVVCMCIYIYACAHAHTHTHTRIYTYSHTHMHTHRHAFIYMCMLVYGVASVSRIDKITSLFCRI